MKRQDYQESNGGQAVLNEQEYTALEHIKNLLDSPIVPDLDDSLAEMPFMEAIHNQLIEIREILYSFSRGDLSPQIKSRGYIAGSIKALQAHLRHMVWQVKQVEQGDFSQRVQFLGEFSSAFNNMVIRLDTVLKSLQKKEETLTELTDNLRNEMNLRESAMEALQESEARFKYLANHDPLTGVLNRRSFLGRADSKLRLAAEHSIPCCLSIMDIDHFKNFNDTYGHPAGDEALKHVVNTVSLVLRKGDFMGRYGGEEFVFLFYNAGIDISAIIVDRIREAIAANPVLIEGMSVHITASFGVSTNITGGESLGTLISRADAALYEAKSSGRNRVVCSK